MNILITGARAPIAADIARVMHQGGHVVYATDCLKYPIGSFSPYIEKYLRMKAPALEYDSFETSMIDAVNKHSIDRIIPTSEEVFWLAQIQRMMPILFAPPMKTLDLLHNKATFAMLMVEMGYGAAVNLRIASRKQALNLPETLTKELIFKPEYSRFGNQVVFSPSHRELALLDYAKPWLAQSRIQGEEVCIYSVAHQGKCLLHTTYKPKYRAGPGASIYFEPASDVRLQPFVEDVIQKLNLSGQISFDVMLTEDNKLIALECNPRGTSGIHLAAQDPARLCAALLGDQGALAHLPLKTQPTPMMLKLAFLAYYGTRLTQKDIRKDLSRASDAMSLAHIPLHGLLMSTMELICESKRSGMSLMDWSTRDIAFNGFES